MNRRQNTAVGVIVFNVWISFWFGLVVWLLSASVAESYAERGGFWTGAVFACWAMLVMIPVDLLLLWLVRRPLTMPEPAETDEERGARVLEVATTKGQDALSDDDRHFLMVWTAKLGEASREAQRTHLRAAFALEGRRSPAVPLVQRNELTPAPVQSVDEAIREHVGSAV